MDSQNRDSAPDAQDRNPVQRVVKVRRDYNAWVAKETIEDYALRFTPRSFRHWHEFKVANTAFGTASFLVLEAVGATLLVQYGFINAALAILVTGCLIFACGLPAYQSLRGEVWARHGSAHTWCWVRLYRLHNYVACLRQFHLCFLCA